MTASPYFPPGHSTSLTEHIGPVVEYLLERILAGMTCRDRKTLSERSLDEGRHTTTKVWISQVCASNGQIAPRSRSLTSVRKAEYRNLNQLGNSLFIPAFNAISMNTAKQVINASTVTAREAFISRLHIPMMTNFSFWHQLLVKEYGVSWEQTMFLKEPCRGSSGGAIRLSGLVLHSN